MHHDTLLKDLAIVLIVAAATIIVFRMLRQPVVLGYLLTGIIIGPHTPPFQWISDRATVDTLAELGVMFLMFALGLEFSLRRLRQVGTTAFVAASLEILLMVLVGYELGQAFGWGRMDSVFLGAILIGAIIAEARQIAKIEALMHPVRDLFSAVFFVSIGLLIDPALLARYAVPILVITAVVVVGKVFTCALGCLAAGHDTRTSLRVGMSLAQIGEFSLSSRPSA